MDGLIGESSASQLCRSRNTIMLKWKPVNDIVGLDPTFSVIRESNRESFPADERQDSFKEVAYNLCCFGKVRMLFIIQINSSGST